MYTHIYLCNRNTQQNFVRISHELSSDNRMDPQIDIKNDPLVRVGYFLQHAMRFHPPWLPSNLIVTTLSLAPVNLGQQAFRSGLSPMFAHAITAAENAQRGAVVQDAIQKTC